MFKSWELWIFIAKPGFKNRKEIFFGPATQSSHLWYASAAFILYFPPSVNVTFVEAASDKRQHLFCSIVQVDPAWGWVCAGPGSPLFCPLLFIPMSAPFATYHPPNSWHFLLIIHLSLIVNRISLFFLTPLPNLKENGSYLISFWFARSANSHTRTHLYPPSLWDIRVVTDWLLLYSEISS